MNYVEEIKKLKAEKNAVIMAHYYQSADIQDIADYIGDSLALAQWAAKTDADIIQGLIIQVTWLIIIVILGMISSNKILKKVSVQGG